MKFRMGEISSAYNQGLNYVEAISSLGLGAPPFVIRALYTIPPFGSDNKS